MSRFESDLTRNTIRRLNSIQKKLVASAGHWEGTDNFIAGKVEELAAVIPEIIWEIRMTKKRKKDEE